MEFVVRSQQAGLGVIANFDTVPKQRLDPEGFGQFNGVGSLCVCAMCMRLAVQLNMLFLRRDVVIVEE